MQCASPHTRATRPFLSARQQAVRSVAHQPRQVIARSAETYISPSSRTALSELQALQRYSEVVPDVLLSQTLQNVEAPKAATSSRSVLYGIMKSPSSFGRYKFAVEQASFYDKAQNAATAEEAAALRVDKALVNVGAMFLENVTGRVSTEVDPKHAYDAAALTARGRQLVALYREVGVAPERVILRLPATWAGIRAAEALEREGAATHLVLVYSFAQGAAAAQAGVSVIQPNVGALADYYQRNPGLIRNPKGPRQAATAVPDTFAEQENPGLLLVQDLYCFVKKYHPKTLVMASGLRSKQEALSLAGCDYLVVGPRVLEALAAGSTLAGYNDGLRAQGEASDDEGGVAAALTQALADAAEFSDRERAELDEDTFLDRLGPAGETLLRDGVARLQSDASRLEELLQSVASGQE